MRSSSKVIFIIIRHPNRKMKMFVGKQRFLRFKRNIRLSRCILVEMNSLRALLCQTTETTTQTEENVQPNFSKEDVKVGNEIQMDRDENTKQIIFNSPVILPILFSKMDFKTLNSSKNVCYRWRIESTSEFRKRVKVVHRLELAMPDYPNRTRTRQSANNFKLDTISFLEEYPSKDLEIVDFDIALPKRYFKTLFWSIGESVTSLSLLFNEVYKKELGISPGDVAQMLFSCQNLNYLHFAKVPYEVRLHSMTNLAKIVQEENCKPQRENKRGNFSTHLPLSCIRCLRVTECFFTEDRQFYSREFIVKLFEWMPKLEEIELDVPCEFQGSELIFRLIAGCHLAKRAGYLTNLKELKFQKRNWVHLLFPHILTLSYLHFKLTKLEIGFLDEWKTEGDDDGKPYDGLQIDITILLESYQDTLEIIRFSPKFQHSENQARLLPFPRLQKLRIMEIDWYFVCDNKRTNFSNLPNWEKYKFIYPKCEHRKENYFNKAEFKVRKLDCTDSDDVIKILECRSPELMCEIIPYIILGQKYNVSTVTAISIDLRQTRHNSFVELITHLSKTFIEEINISIGCDSIEEGNYSCCDNAVFSRENISEDTCSLLNNNDETEKNGDIYPKLRNFELTSLGCRKINLGFLKKWILPRVTSSPCLERAILKYKPPSIN